LCDYAISSYTPTLATLLTPRPPTVNPFKIAVVIQPNTPGHPPLPFTESELEKIRSHVPNESLVTFGVPGSPASVGTIFSQLPDLSIIHLACHGRQDLRSPLESALLLEDGDLKVSQIIRMSLPNASLAFLSACQTAKGDENLPDEAIHLASSLLFAGFRGVVATMW
jgi:CHAT domain-containing protein